ncbi:MAG: monovalent cation/H(+) antiporter subunit G [Opitutaceae bacterium]|nr:monovalent cation/H(+) antiporter subunit G [Opitutaceae bacterium]
MSAIISTAVMVLGALIVLISMIGLVRFPDVFCRSHALGKGLTLGLMVLLFGLWLDPESGVSGLKVVAAIFFQFVTLPVASHLLARLSYEKNLPRHHKPEADQP